MKPFDLNEALNGALIGIAVTSEEELPRNSGHLRIEDGKRIVWIDGHKIMISADGIVRSCTPSDSRFVPGTVLQIFERTINTTYGSEVTQTRSPSEGRNRTVSISNMEPRDYFALEAMKIIMQGIPHPEAADDATILFVARASYKWSLGMLEAAADSRLGESTTPSTDIDVNSNDLQSDTDKLLYNICEALKNGVTVKGSATDDDAPIRTKIAEMPAVSFNGTPSVNVANTPQVSVSGTPWVNVNNTPRVSISGTPYVNVSNTPSVSVSNMPSEPIEVSVNNFPSNQ